METILWILLAIIVSLLISIATGKYLHKKSYGYYFDVFMVWLFDNQDLLDAITGALNSEEIEDFWKFTKNTEPDTWLLYPMNKDKKHNRDFWIKQNQKWISYLGE